eukprot:3564995-Pleurochrysis_carterae.AAC.2
MQNFRKHKHELNLRPSAELADPRLPMTFSPEVRSHDSNSATLGRERAYACAPTRAAGGRGARARACAGKPPPLRALQALDSV